MLQNSPRFVSVPPHILIIKGLFNKPEEAMALKLSNCQAVHPSFKKIELGTKKPAVRQLVSLY